MRVYEFQAGDQVPSWMLESEPTSSNSLPPLITFTVAVRVYDDIDCYYVRPMQTSGPHVIYVQDGRDVVTFATTKKVVIAVTFQAIGVLDPLK